MSQNNGMLSYKNLLISISELVQLKLDIETSVGESTPTEATKNAPPLIEVGVLRLDKECKVKNMIAKGEGCKNIRGVERK